MTTIQLLKDYTLIDTIILDSDFRNDPNTTSTTDFTIDIIKANRTPKYFQFQNVIVPLGMDNITSDYNQFKINGTTYTVPTGIYIKIGDLLSAMNILITGTNITFTQGLNSKITVASSTSTIFTFDPSTMYYTLGFSAGLKTGQFTYGASFVPDIVQSNYYTLHSEILSQQDTNKTIHSDGRPNTILVVSNFDTPPSGILNYSPKLDDENILYVGNMAPNIKTLDFQLKDDYANTVVMNPAIQIVINRYG